MASDGSVQEQITAFWNTVAPEYEAHPGNVPERGSAELPAWVEAIRALLPRAPADVLDVATGTGFVARIAAALGHRVTGIDLAPSMLDEARQAAEQSGLAVRLETRDALSPGFAPGSFDAIVCRHFLWTLREPETALRAWRELLRAGGRVVAIDGFWFRDPQASHADETGEPNLFDRFYDARTRAALPGMSFTSPAQAGALFEHSGFARVELRDLASVHALAADPPSPEPWYVVVAYR